MSSTYPICHLCALMNWMELILSEVFFTTLIGASKFMGKYLGSCEWKRTGMFNIFVSWLRKQESGGHRVIV